MQPEQLTNKNWPHVDQNDHDERIPCKQWEVYQGILYVWSSEATHASTTVVWPGSHKEAYAQYMSDPRIATRIARGKPHFTLISGMEPGAARARLSQGWEAQARRVPVPAGALLLFSSRTTHQGWSGGPRLAQPVCWEPVVRRDDLARERKLRLAVLGLPSTHWASLALPHELITQDHGSEQRATPVDATGAATHDEVIFPLRASIRPRALRADVDQDDLWTQLVDAEWFAPLPAKLAQLLEESVTEEFKAIL